MACYNTIVRIKLLNKSHCERFAYLLRRTGEIKAVFHAILLQLCCRYFKRLSLRKHSLYGDDNAVLIVLRALLLGCNLHAIAKDNPFVRLIVKLRLHVHAAGGKITTINQYVLFLLKPSTANHNASVSATMKRRAAAYHLHWVIRLIALLLS